MHILIKEIYGAINASLNETKYEQIISDQRAFTKAVVENGLTGLIYEWIDIKEFDDKYQNILTQTYYHFIRRDVGQQEMIKRLRKLFIKEEMPFIFLKGAHLKNLYPKTFYRGMTDIDILVKESDYKKINRMLREHQYHCIEKYYFHNTYVYKGIGEHIELHPFIQHDFDHAFDGMFLDPFEHIISNEHVEKKFTHEYELTYLLYHLAKHVETSGIGIRSILDIYIYSKKMHLNLDILNQLLTNTKLKGFYELIMAIHKYYFEEALTMQHFDFDRFQEEEMERVVLDCLKTGMHGKATNETYARMLGTKEVHTFGQKIGLLIKTLFPGYKKISKRYILLKYVPILIPVYWIIRIFRLAFINTKTSMKKINQLISKKSDEKDINKKDYYL